MAFNRMTVGQLGSILSDTVVVDRYSQEIVFFSAVSYTTLIQASIKEISKLGNSVLVSGVGSYRVCKQGYEIEVKKNQIAIMFMH